MAEQPKHKEPEGMEPYDLGGPGDLGGVSSEQQEELNRFKVFMLKILAKMNSFDQKWIDFKPKV